MKEMLTGAKMVDVAILLLVQKLLDEFTNIILDDILTAYEKYPAYH